MTESERVGQRRAMEITLDDHTVKAIARRVEAAHESAANDPDGGWDVEVCEALAEHLGPAVARAVTRRGEMGLREHLFEAVHAWEGGSLAALLRTVAFTLGDLGVDLAWSDATVDAIDRSAGRGLADGGDLGDGDV